MDDEYDIDYECDEIEYDDERTSYGKETADRLDMGRNEAGEWLGYC